MKRKIAISILFAWIFLIFCGFLWLEEDAETPIIVESYPVHVRIEPPQPQSAKQMTVMSIVEEKEEPIIENEFSEDDIRLLSSIVFAEAGNQCYAGKAAVAIVVMNRTRSDEFPNSIKEVIYQQKPVTQFAPTKNGSYDEALSLYDNNKLPQECIEAALYALNENTTVEYESAEYELEDILFFSRRIKNYSIQIGQHQFK